MFTMFSLLLPAVALLSSLCQAVIVPDDPLTVKTNTGIFTGLIDPQFPNVRQFRSIPYALPPVGPRRWLPPVAVSPSLKHTYSYRFPPACPQYLSKNASAWTTSIADFAVRTYGQSLLAGAMSQSTSEDCLYLAIWAPLNVTASDNLPVALFLPGGDFQAGGVDVPYQKPTPWVSRSQSHIVVTTNYRVNIAGFPWAAGLDTHNVGLYDARMALEWVHTNIRYFGGDNSRITLWGQSAGGVAADMVAHAWSDEPLINSLYLMSGTAQVAINPPDPAHSNFTFVAKNLGCDLPTDAVAELNCMRQVPMTLIQNYIGQYRDNSTKPSLNFRPSPDEKTVFRNYTARALSGGLAKVPTIISLTSNEQSTLYKYPVSNLTEGPYQPSVDAGTVGIFVCLASNSTSVRQQLNITTYRYEYAGNFSSVTPLWWMGAYHASDIPMVFGTYEGRFGAAPLLSTAEPTSSPGGVGAIKYMRGNGSASSSYLDDKGQQSGNGWGGKVTSYQRQVAERMQDWVLEFMKDPENGPRRNGWLAYGDQPQGQGEEGLQDRKWMVRIAANEILARNVSASEVDEACTLGRKWISAPV